MRAQLELRYIGPAVEAGTMDVYEVSKNMVAFSDFVLIVAKSVYGQDVKARAQVSGHAAGSFGTDIVFQIAGPVASILSALPSNPLDFIKFVKEAIELYKFLKGEAPAKVSHTENQNVEVINNNGEIKQFNIASLQVVFNGQAGEAVRAFAQQPLLQGGIEEILIGGPDMPVARIGQEEAGSFQPISRLEPLTDTVARAGLVIESASFKDGNKWRFYDGQISFFADILDPEFLARVDAGEAFAKGDVLMVDLQIKQEVEGQKISTTRAVVKVIEHRQRSQQGNIFQR